MPEHQEVAMAMQKRWEEFSVEPHMFFANRMLPLVKTLNISFVYANEGQEEPAR